MLRNEIISFRQFESEALHEAWSRFRKMLRNCPHHDIPKHTLVSTFYHGLTPNNRAIVDFAAGGDLFRKSASEAYDLINELARKSIQWQSDKFAGPPRNKIFSVEKEVPNAAMVEVTKKLDTLIAQMSITKPTQVLMCTHCQGDHESGDCQTGSTFAGDNEHVSYVGGNQRYNNYPPHNNAYNNYGNQGWRQRAQHPNLSYGNNNNVLKPSPEFANEYKEQGLGNPTYQQGQSSQKPPTPKQDDPVLSLLKDISTRLANNEAYCRDLGNQVAQINRERQERPQGSLPSKTEKNPKVQQMETAQVITLRSGKEMEPFYATKVTTESSPKVSEELGEVNPDSESTNSPLAKNNKEQVKPFIPKLPYPYRLRKDKLDLKYSKFLDMLKKLKVNITFAEMMEEMPLYTKFLKELVTKKRRLNDHEVVALTEECSAIISQKLPPKKRDQGSFSIPCQIGGLFIENVLCDLGAIINLMPLSIFRKLGLRDPKPINMTLQLADRSIARPMGIVEDVLVKVDKFIFPVDFVVLDMEEDNMVPILLGRPFLATGRTLIDVEKGKLTLRLQDEEVVFNVYDAMKFSSIDLARCNFICDDTIDACFEDSFYRLNVNPSENGEKNVEGELREEASHIWDVEYVGTSPQEECKWVKSRFVNLDRETKPAPKSSLEEPPKLDLKPLPPNLKYVFLHPPSDLPVVISSLLSSKQEEELLEVLRRHKGAFGWSIHDIKGISPAMCTHRIFLDDEIKPSVQPQRRLNPNMMEVVKAEVIKLLDAGLFQSSGSAYTPWG
ncbi:hypothetical protein M5689_000670 [Euphorbia peplus]|nr:hypothetical protein M5689_000670 [Euphorbia peplus]